MAARRHTTPVMAPLYQYLKNNSDTVISLFDLRNDLPLNPTSMDSAINRMVANPEYRVFRGPTKGTYIYRSGPKDKSVPPTFEEEKPHGSVIPESRPIPGLKGEPVLRLTGKDAVEALTVIPGNTASALPSPNRSYQFVGHMNNVADILRDTRDNLWVAMPLDTYINGKPSK
jgi:hypothetical protein